MDTFLTKAFLDADAVKVSKLTEDVKKLEEELAEMKGHTTGERGDLTGMTRQQLARIFVATTGEIAKIRRIEERGELTRLLAAKMSSHRMMLGALELQYTKRVKAGPPPVDSVHL